MRNTLFKTMNVFIAVWQEYMLFCHHRASIAALNAVIVGSLLGTSIMLTATGGRSPISDLMLIVAVSTVVLQALIHETVDDGQ